MKCPNDGATLTMSERGGVEIDYRPECSGVWLDRGELDQILDRAASETPAAPQPGYQQPSQPNYQVSYQGNARRGQPQGAGRPKRKEHWLSELLG